MLKLVYLAEFVDINLKYIASNASVMMSLSVGYLQISASGYPDSKFTIRFSPTPYMVIRWFMPRNGERRRLLTFHIWSYGSSCYGAVNDKDYVRKSAGSPQAHTWYCFVVCLMERDERLMRRELYRIRSTETPQQREVRLAARREQERRRRAIMTSEDRQA